jgi:hypothetical protein
MLSPLAFAVPEISGRGQWAMGRDEKTVISSVSGDEYFASNGASLYQRRGDNRLTTAFCFLPSAFCLLLLPTAH